MKWTRAVQHLEHLAEECARLSGMPIFLPVTQLWTFGEILELPHDLAVVEVALVVDLPVDDVPWRSEPSGTQHWAHATRLDRNPISVKWRPAGVPVWNHYIVRPVLLWDNENGVVTDAVDALRRGEAESFRLPGPTVDELRQRVADELAVSLAALRRTTAAYEQRRWAPGKLTPHSDALWQASSGYLDLLSAAPA